MTIREQTPKPDRFQRAMVRINDTVVSCEFDDTLLKLTYLHSFFLLKHG